MAVLLLILFMIFIMGGMEISIGLGIASIGAVLLGGGVLDLIVIPQRIMSIVSRAWPLLSIPMFVMLGEVFSKGGISRRLVDVSSVFIGRVRGGLGIVNIVASFFFGGISGSAAADTVAIGGVLIPAMVQQGYDSPFSTVVTITSSTLGPIVPPSILMVIIAWVTELSVGGLFLTGYPAGVLLMVGLIITTYVHSVRRKYPLSEKFSFEEAMKIIKESFPALITPIIIVAGIVFGVTTVVEASAVALVYGVLVSFIVYKELKLSDLPAIFKVTVRSVASIGLLTALSSGFAWVLTYTRVPYYIARLIASANIGPITFMSLTVFIYLILGCFLNPGSIVIMTMPILFPIAKSLGIDPYHYCIVSTLAMQIGHVTPPVGQCLFIGCSISGDKVEDLVPLLIPYILSILAVIFVIMLFPNLVLWAPKMLSY